MYHLRLNRRLALAAIVALVLALVPSSVVLAGAANHFMVTGPGLVNTAVSHTYTITALDGSDVVDVSYAGTVDITCSDTETGVDCPLNPSGFVYGVATVDVTLVTTGAQTITAKDHDNGSISGQWAPTVLTASAATHLVVVAPPAASVGIPASVTATAKNDAGVTDATYAGPATMTSTDASAGYSANPITFASGVGHVDVTFSAVGTPTVTATDDALASLKGTSDPVTVDKGTPVITWSDPGDITYGTALSGTQLNASHSVPGTLTYTPISGTVLNARAVISLSRPTSCPMTPPTTTTRPRSSTSTLARPRPISPGPTPPRSPMEPP